MMKYEKSERTITHLSFFGHYSISTAGDMVINGIYISYNWKGITF